MFKSNVVIGLECHIPINKVNSKLFCSCSLPRQDSAPNTHTCPTCLSMPGSKPVVNKKAIEYSLKLALALKCDIQKEIVFSRKVYMYPDLPSGYQITQYEIPLGLKGFIQLDSGKKIKLKRVHIEEDPGALIHPSGMQSSQYVLIDYNRAGTPLCEVVTEPEINSPEEAREFMNKLIQIVKYLNIYDPDKNPIKADANISIKESGYTRTEIKNISGFKEIERALYYEYDRQKIALAEGKKLFQETRAWDSDKGITFSLRTKETEEDYGYIIDPNLVPIEITDNWLKEIKKTLPELAHEKVKKFTAEHGISEEMAKIISKDKALAEMFEAVSTAVNPELAAKWIRRELARVLNYHKKKLDDTKIQDIHMIDLLRLVEQKTITERVAQKIIEKLVEAPFDVSKYVKKERLETLSDDSELESHCKQAIKNNFNAVNEYKSGKEQALNFLVGQVMNSTKGKADAKKVKEIIKRLV